LRSDLSLAERVCRELIRAHRMEGIKFRRQHPIGAYFADFACVSLKLVIEIDGDHHDNQMEADARRTQGMEGLGWHVVRFSARQVLENREGIWAEFRSLISQRASPPLLASPPSGGVEHEGERIEGSRTP
jgi:very-short-patch-repair endonuclease